MDALTSLGKFIMNWKCILAANAHRLLIMARRLYRLLVVIPPKRSLNTRSLAGCVFQIKHCRNLLAGIVVLSLAGFASVTAEANFLTGTIHDMSIYGDVVDNANSCTFCHGSQDARDVELSLWNKYEPASGFQLYSSNTINAVVNEPGAESRVCLSCHDGTIAFDARNGSTGTKNNNMSIHFADSSAIIGTDLRNDHPIGVNISSDFGGIRDELIIMNAGLKIFDGKVECASCHDPHGSGGYPFLLRLDPAGPNLCLCCHIK